MIFEEALLDYSSFLWNSNSNLIVLAKKGYGLGICPFSFFSSHSLLVGTIANLT
ncbi:hypothetical protein LguiB_005905 [Lonicera macranthoides]